MKSKLLYYTALCILSLGSSLSLVSCQDDLDITPDGRLTMEEVFNDADRTEAYFASAFTVIPYKGLWYFWFDNLPSALSDESWSCDDVEGTGAINAYKGQGSSSDNIFEKYVMLDFDSSYWERYWHAISIINNFLANTDHAAFRSEAFRDQLICEAKILRAYYYLQLVKWYGDLPLLTDPTNIDGTFAEPLERKPARDILKFIVEDCNSTLDNPDLPWRNLQPQGRDYRMTKGIACAIMSQASLFAASKLYNGGENLWQWAYEINQKVLNLLRDADFSLYTQQTVKTNEGKFAYNSAYGEYFAERELDYPLDKETIFESVKLNHPCYWVWGLPIQTNYRTGDVPTQELVDSYDMLKTGLPVLDREQPYLDEQHLQPNYYPQSGYNKTRPYTGRDLRFEATVLHDASSIWLGKNEKKLIEIYKGGNCETRSNSRTYTRTGYYNNKYRNWYNIGSERTEDGNWKYFRFAEILLNYAEAAIEANHVSEGMLAVNEVRHRAGFSPSVDLQPTSVDEARLIVRKERRVEFVFEEHRFFDCRRWTSIDENIECEKFCTGVTIEKAGLRSTYTRFVVGSDGAAPSKLSYLAKWHFLPIPLNESSILEEQTGNKWQNPGW